ncbi:hypothetical protein SAMN04488516_102170 [Desulfonauticus submarinus]|uniref:Uncharacterized protein n=1 Tax=Desulfonauticus submarinus TaxID=206665 RepID=A0A1H0BHA0_9BACT|nr:hypothetical protein [Desulfonauticus submarinus]SDN44945.1 hypothetical protein SAMN04488516_102170 [Desulfonauticus submarinus]
MRYLKFIFVVALILNCGCSSKEMEKILWPSESTDYYSISKKWTNNQKIYVGLDEVIDVSCVYKSMDWRKAFVRKWAKVYSLSKEEKDAFSQKVLEEGKESIEFFVAISSTTDELSKIKILSPLWSIFLVQNNKKIYPLEVRELEWPYPKIKEFFPFTNPWQSFYIIRFPYIANFKELMFAGPEGQVVFTW